MIIALSVFGASGKMGKRVVALAHDDPTFHSVTTANLAACDVVIDFSSPEATQNHLAAALHANKPVVLGTTGHDAAGKKAIEEAAKRIPILFSPNFSFGIALCLEMASHLGRALYGSCTIDIVETHHIDKKDRPSGTALALADAVSNNSTIILKSTEPRKKEEILIHAIRSLEVVGEHTLIFEWGSEKIELKHTASSRDAFAQGALMGAKFLVQQPPGLYSLKNLFEKG